MDENVALFARSDSGNPPYRVEFRFENGRMFVKCNCPAGRFRKFCKHKLGLLKGNDYWLSEDVDVDQYDRLAYVADRAQKSGYLDYIIQASKLQQAVDEAESNLKDFHKKFGAAMKKGVTTE